MSTIFWIIKPAIEIGTAGHLIIITPSSDCCSSPSYRSFEENDESKPSDASRLSTVSGIHLHWGTQQATFNPNTICVAYGCYSILTLPFTHRSRYSCREVEAFLPSGKVASSYGNSRWAEGTVFGSRVTKASVVLLVYWFPDGWRKFVPIELIALICS